MTEMEHAMEIDLPADCGNSPRMVIVGEFVSSWAQGDTGAVSTWLANDVTWARIGGETHAGPGAAAHSDPPIRADRVHVLSIVTHGRLASCDGYLESGARRIAFSHVFRFAGATKTAKVAEIRSYYVKTH